MILLTGGVPGPGGGVPGPRGGVCSWGGAWSQGVSGPGGCLARGGCLVETPPGMATAAGSTHPTEIHSCLNIGSF